MFVPIEIHKSCKIRCISIESGLFARAVRDEYEEVRRDFRHGRISRARVSAGDLEMLIEIKGMALKGSRILEGARAVISDPLFIKEDPDRRKIRGRKRKLVRAGVTQRTKVKPSIDRDCPDVLAGAPGRSANRLELRAACLTLIWPRSTHTYSSPGCSLLHEQEKAFWWFRRVEFLAVPRHETLRAGIQRPLKTSPVSHLQRLSNSWSLGLAAAQGFSTALPRRWAIDLEVREFSNLPML